MALSDKEILNLVPFPTLLFTATEPPIYSIIYLQILNPSPVPFKFICLCSFSLAKSVKSFPIFSLDMPAPLS